MRKREIFAVLSTICLVTVGVTTTDIFAGELFHSGRAGRCEECHLFGDAGDAGQGSALEGTEAGAAKGGRRGGKFMLRGSDASSTCLRCHEAPPDQLEPKDYFVATPRNLLQSAPRQLTPGGDFGWLKRNYRWNLGGGMDQSPGDRHGHNIVAADFGYSADTARAVAPGGNYPAGSLSCTSCHDPHGRYRRDAGGSVTTDGPPIVGSGSYDTSADPDAKGSVGTFRLLAGKGYQPAALGGEPFASDPPAAVAPANYNRRETSGDTRVAYGSGMSEWCQNCHGSIHNDGGAGGNQHPAGNNAKLTLDTMDNYNYYVASGDLSGRRDTAYSSLVPFEMGTADYTVLKGTANSNGSVTAGPGAGANVMCLSCHRAHASGWDSMTRWNTKSTFLVVNGHYPGMDNGADPQYAQGRTETEVRMAYYDRPASRYAPFQRSLCNKCHAKD